MLFATCFRLCSIFVCVCVCVYIYIYISVSHFTIILNMLYLLPSLPSFIHFKSFTLFRNSHLCYSNKNIGCMQNIVSKIYVKKKTIQDIDINSTILWRNSWGSLLNLLVASDVPLSIREHKIIAILCAWIKQNEFGYCHPMSFWNTF